MSVDRDEFTLELPPFIATGLGDAFPPRFGDNRDLYHKSKIKFKEMARILKKNYKNNISASYCLRKLTLEI